MVRQIIYAESSRREYRKFLGVLVFVALSATLMSTLISFHWADWLRWFIGSFLMVFGSFKLISYETFAQVFPRYDLLGQKYSFYTTIYPLLEVFLGICYILDLIPGERNFITLVIMVASLIGVFNNLERHGPSRQSTTLGKLLKLPLTTCLLFEAVIASLITVVLVLHSLLN